MKKMIKGLIWAIGSLIVVSCSTNLKVAKENNWVIKETYQNQEDLRCIYEEYNQEITNQKLSPGYYPQDQLFPEEKNKLEFDSLQVLQERQFYKENHKD